MRLWDAQLENMNMFHVFHWLIVELAILILCTWIFYYEVREFMYGRRRYWVERLVVQTVRMICCAIFSLVRKENIFPVLMQKILESLSKDIFFLVHVFSPSIF